MSEFKWRHFEGQIILTGGSLVLPVWHELS